MNSNNKREELLFSMLDAPASPRMGPYFKSGSEKPIQLFIMFEWIVHRFNDGGGLFTELFKIWIHREELRKPIQLSIMFEWLVHRFNDGDGLLNQL